jgi:KipI family sensor histidine kinase inhibitor
VSTRVPRILPVGDAALTVEFGRTLDPLLNARVRGLDAALAASPFPGLRESVPAFASLLVLYDPARCGFADACHAVQRLLDGPPPPTTGLRRHLIPVAYGGDDGPDLPEVALARGLSKEDVVARHCAIDYTALFVGFLPGFAYLASIDAALETPRRGTPRTRVPAGSVAIAGRLTGVYPFASPGGWSLIGRTSTVLFDPFATEPALIRPGDTVRFAASAMREEPRLPRAAPHATPRAIDVLDGGLLTTVQDGGRHGHRRLGVPTCGALQRGAAAAANRAVGNATTCAVLECTAVGPTLRFLVTTRFAVAGADLRAVLERADLGSWPVPSGRAIVARPGNVLSMRERRDGLRAYVAIAGGFDVPPVLGSCATDLVAGFGGLEGRALRAGDTLAGRDAPSEGDATVNPPSDATPSGPVLLRVVAGPQDDMFTEEARQRLERDVYEVGALSDRTGCRLQGPPLPHRDKGEILTDGMVPGCIQVPPDGQPIVMLADGPTTGGYPKVATVVSADLDFLAQLGPGDGVRFRVITVEQAQGAR